MNSGISTVEIMVALAIMAMATSAAAGIGLNVPGIVADARSASAALDHAREALGQSDGSLSEESLEDESFVRRTSLAPWVSSRGGARIVQLSAVMDKDNEPEACDPFTSRDWSHPTVVQSIPLDNLGLPAGAYTISDLAISPGMLVVSIASTSEATEPTLLFFALSGTSTPLLSGAFDNATASRIGNSSVVVQGTYAFSGNAFSSSSTSTCDNAVSCAQIAVYASGSLISLLSLATSSPPFARRADGGSAPVSALAYHAGYLYVGLAKTSGGDEFNIVDATDPAHVRWLSGFPVGRTVNSIAVRDNRAYVGTDDPSRELMVFDVENPDRPALLESWDAPGASTFGYGSAATVFGDFVRFGRTYTSNAPEFELLKVAGGTISEISSQDSGSAQDPESVRALSTQDRLTFVLLTHRVDVLDTHEPSQVRSVGTYALPANAQGAALACRNDRIYVARNGADGRGVIDILQGS